MYFHKYSIVYTLTSRPVLTPNISACILQQKIHMHMAIHQFVIDQRPNVRHTSKCYNHGWLKPSSIHKCFEQCLLHMFTLSRFIWLSCIVRYALNWGFIHRFLLSWQWIYSWVLKWELSESSKHLLGMVQYIITSKVKMNILLFSDFGSIELVWVGSLWHYVQLKAGDLLLLNIVSHKLPMY